MNSTHTPAPFIVGAPRSGTTLLRMMLDAHPELAIPPETFFISLLRRKWKETHFPDAIVDSFVNHQRWPDFNIDADRFRARVTSASPATVADVWRLFYSMYAEQHGKRRWGDKTPGYVLEMQRIAEILPEAHFIHVIRDGRDVAASVIPLWFGPNSIEDAATWWKEHAEAGRSSGNGLHYVEVRYEQLVSNPGLQLRRLCGFVELQFRSEMLAAYTTAGERLAEQKALPKQGVSAELRAQIHRNLTEPPHSRSVGRWRTEMTSDEQRRFEALAGDTLEELGYPVGANTRSRAGRQAHDRPPAGRAPEDGGRPTPSPAPDSSSVSELRHVLVTGSPHETVVEVGMLLNEHPHVLMGIERFSALQGMVDRFLLSPERLIAPLSVETTVRGELLYSRLRKRAASDQLALTGDADAAYVEALPSVGLRSGIWRAVVVIGDRPSTAPGKWQAAVRLVQESQRRWFSDRVLVLPYREFASAREPWLEVLLAFLELPNVDLVDEAHARLRDRLGPPPEDPAADAPKQFEWLRKRAELELRRPSSARPAPPRLPLAPLTGAELGVRVRERKELNAQMRRGAGWPDDREAVRARYAEHARETVERGVRVTELNLTAATGMPSAGLRINIVAPPAREYELGRSDAVHGLATNLARLCTVRLLATSRPRGRPLGVALRIAPKLTPDMFRDCDAVIYPAELEDAHRLIGSTPALLWLDGFAAPDDQRVLASVQSAQLVLAASTWLCELARQHGTPAIHVPPGLDRSVFAPGPGSDERELHVTGIAQAADHLGCAELSEAMVRVRETQPEVEVTLIGGVPADGATRFLHHPTLAGLAHTLRSSAVHVTSAREEGFNFTGAAALASGAALVSTDTRGSRDYAIHDRTCLVSPVGDPQALADHVLTLLQDSDRRARLVRDGAKYVRSIMRPWSELARSLALLVTERA